MSQFQFGGGQGYGGGISSNKGPAVPRPKKNQTTLRRRRRKMLSRKPLEVQLKELLKKY